MFEQCYTTRGDFVPRTFDNVCTHLGCHAGGEDTLHTEELPSPGVWMGKSARQDANALTLTFPGTK